MNIIKTLMNDILCQKCNAKQSKINMEFSTFYKCQICKNTCCINCMYLCMMTPILYNNETYIKTKLKIYIYT